MITLLMLMQSAAGPVGDAVAYASAKALGFSIENAIYFATGLLCTFFRCLVSGSQDTISKRTFISLFIGGIASVFFASIAIRLPIIGSELGALSPVALASFTGLMAFVTDWAVVATAWRRGWFKDAN